MNQLERNTLRLEQLLNGAPEYYDGEMNLLIKWLEVSK